MDALDPLFDLGVHPGRLGLARPHEAAHVAVPLRVAEVEFGQGIEGGGRGRKRSDEDRLVWFREVSPARTKFQEEALCSGYSADWAGHCRVVRVPWLDDRRDGRPDGLGERRQRETIQDHGEWVPLGDPLSREDDLAVAAAPPQEELGRVPVAVEAKPGAVGLAVPHGPEHCFAAELIEAVSCIDEEDG